MFCRNRERSGTGPMPGTAPSTYATEPGSLIREFVGLYQNL